MLLIMEGSGCLEVGQTDRVIACRSVAHDTEITDGKPVLRQTDLHMIDSNILKTLPPQKTKTKKNPKQPG